MSKKPLMIIVGVLALLALVRFALPMLNPPNDQKLIREALQDSIEASREGRPGGVMDMLSDRLQINNMTPGSRSQIANFIKNSQPDVKVFNDKAVITGDVATIVTPVEITLPVFGSRRVSEVTLTFKKEEALKYLLIPTRKWRLTEVHAPDTAVGEFLQMG